MLCLTLDSDWVPDFVLEYTLQALAVYDVRSTIFCTSPYTNPLLAKHEVALHPNLMEDATTGDTEESRLEYLKKIYVAAIGVRTHRLYWHSKLPELFFKAGLKYDSSLFCPLQKGLHPYIDMGITRFPLWWVDTFHCRSNFALDTFAPPGLIDPGLKILLFHPLHIYLNSTSLEASKKALSGLHLPNSSESELKLRRNPGNGIETLFISALKLLSQNEHATLKNLFYAQ